ncbi:MAG: hypothetical protein R3E39_09375 [Anaerolineae bacterium]
MSNVRRFLLIIVIVALVIVLGNVLSHTVRNSTTHDGQVIFTDSYTLTNDLSEDLFIMADTASVTAESHITGDAAVVGRTRASVEGEVDGDLVLMGAELTFSPDAHVTGDAAFIGNQIALGGVVEGKLKVIADKVNILPGAQLPANPEVCASHISDERSDSRPLQNCGADELASWQSLRDGSFVTETLGAGGFSSEGLLLSIGFTLAMTAFAGVIVTVFPRAFSYMTQAARQLPGRLARVGCLSLLLLPGIGAVLLLALALLPPLGLLLLPIMCLLTIPVLLFFAAGWMTMALLLGDGILRRLVHRASPPITTMMAGSFALLLAWLVATALPYGSLIGLGLMLLIGVVGLGSALVTRLGTRSPTRRHFVQG